jgi:CMP-N,N'-diacetyllegionaminic acid synthase
MIAIIPARGGSKGLPGKNIKELYGKPLIAYTIEAALNSKVISRVILSTDDEDIARIGKEYGAELPFMRPKNLASDNAKAIDVYLNTLNGLEKTEGKDIDEFIVLQPTSPLRTAKDIDQAYKLFKEKRADSVISFCRELQPISWHKYVDESGCLIPIFKNTIRNRQEEKPSYFPNGAIYIFKKWLIEKRKYYSKNTFAYIMPRTRSVDIDSLEDFQYAEFLMKNKF